MEINGVFTLLGVIIASIFSQTIAVWIKFTNLEKKIVENNGKLEVKITESKCPFGKCPLYSRAVDEAVPQRIIQDVIKEREND